MSPTAAGTLTRPHTTDDIDRLDFAPTATITRKTIIDRVIAEVTPYVTPKTAAKFVDTYIKSAAAFTDGTVKETDSQGRATFFLSSLGQAVHDVMDKVVPDNTTPAPGSIHADLAQLTRCTLVHVRRDDNCGYALTAS